MTTTTTSFDEPQIQCRFVAQAWTGRKFDTAVEVEPRRETRFSVPRSWLNGPLPESCTDEADLLRDYEGAPEWIRQWDGPFEVYLLNREALLLGEDEQIRAFARAQGLPIEEARRLCEAADQKFDAQRQEAIAEWEAEEGDGPPRN